MTSITRRICRTGALTIWMTAWSGCANIPFTQQDSDTPHARAQRLRQDDISMGMPMAEVLARWGEPWNIEIAGERPRGYQKWTYAAGSRDWSMAPQRVVYFEQGHVAGWETQDSPF